MAKEKRKEEGSWMYIKMLKNDRNKAKIKEEKVERKLLTNIKIHRMLHHFYDNRTFLC